MVDTVQLANKVYSFDSVSKELKPKEPNMFAPKPLSADLRRTLLNQRASLGRDGDVISMDNFTKGTFRIGPMNPEVGPGVSFSKFFSKVLNKGSTSLQTWGYDDPLLAAWEYLMQNAPGTTKEEKKKKREEISAICNFSRAYWLPVIWKEKFEPANPRIHILPCGIKAYGQIIDYMMANEPGEDITDPESGRYFVYEKEGTKFETKYKATYFHDRGPIHDDPAVQARCLDKFRHYDVRAKFWPVDWDIWSKMYAAIVGEPPELERIKAEFEEVASGTYTPDGDEPPQDNGDGDEGTEAIAPSTTTAAGNGQTVNTTPAPTSAVGGGQKIIKAGDRVKFLVNDAEHTATVMTVGNPDDTGDIPFATVSLVNNLTYNLWTSLIEEKKVTVLPPEIPKEVKPSKGITTAPATKGITSSPVKEPEKAKEPETKTTRPTTASSAMAAKLAAMKNKSKKK